MNKDDWRITGQEGYLRGIDLTFKKYHKKSEEFEHEHCEFCWEKISEYEGDQHFGYCTLDERFWICENCFNDFKEEFQWNIINK